MKRKITVTIDYDVYKELVNLKMDKAFEKISDVIKDLLNSNV